MKCPKYQSEDPLTSHFYFDCGTPPVSSKAISSQTETLENPKDELTTVSTFKKRCQIIEELGKGGISKVNKTHETETNKK